jgi:hypothetical protein
MLEQPLPGRAATELHGCDLFAPHLDSFVATLERLGYASSTVRQHLRLLRDLARWLGRQGLALAQLQEPLADHFLEQRRLRRRLRGYPESRFGPRIPEVSGVHTTPYIPVTRCATPIRPSVIATRPT